MPTPDGRTMYMLRIADPVTGSEELHGADTLPPLVGVVIPGYETVVSTVEDPGGGLGLLDKRATFMEQVADELQPALLAQAVADRVGDAVELPLAGLLDRAHDLGLLSASGRQVMGNACKLPHAFPVFDGAWDELVPLVIVSTAYVDDQGGWLPKPRGEKVIELDPLDERVFLQTLDQVGLLEFHSLVPEDAATVEETVV